MFPLKNINEVLKKIHPTIDINILLTQEQWDNIIKWRNIYLGTADWNKKNIPSLNTAYSICREIAMNATIEFESKIEGNDYLNEQYQEVIENLLGMIESVCWGGSIVLRPFFDNGRILVNVAEAGTFAPIKKDRQGNITSMVFLEFQQAGDKFYTMLEVHEWQDGVYTINRTAYKSNSAALLGSEISLEHIAEWADLEPDIQIENTSRVWFVPLEINNNEAIFDRVIDLMRLLDKNDAEITREIELARAKIFGSSDFVEFDKNTGKSNKLPDDYYIGIDKEDVPITLWTPDIRIEALKERSEMLKRQIESVLSLYNGTLSEPASIERTATEIKHGRQEFFVLINSIQKSMQKSLTTLALVMDEIAAYKDMPHGITEENISFDIGDNILVTEEERFAEVDRKINIMRSLQGINVISPAETRAAFIKYADFMPTKQEVIKAQQSLPQTGTGNEVI